MDDIAALPVRDRRELFAIVAEEARKTLGMNLSPAVVEKDFWVCWTLLKLFTLPEAAVADGKPKLIFKGGTSLSKVFGAIYRFSEDIDVSVEPRLLGVNLEPLDDPGLSRTKLKEIGEQLTRGCLQYTRERVAPALQAATGAVLGNEAWWADRSSDTHGPILVFLYPRASDPASYVLPGVRLELGARADLHPWHYGDMRPYVWDVRPDAFEQGREGATVSVPTLDAERTFWEKVTLLHVENNRADRPPDEEPRAWRRISRHGYDLAMLARTEVAERALADTGLFRRVCRTKDLWFRSGFSDYEKLDRSRVSIVPKLQLRRAFIRDYASMKAMFFVEPPTIDDLLDDLAALEARIREDR